MCFLFLAVVEEASCTACPPPLPESQMFKWRQRGRILWFSLVLPRPCTSQLLLAAAVISQDGEGRWWLAVSLPQLYSDLALCAAARTLRCGFRFILFDMLLVCWQGELLLPCRTSEMLRCLSLCLHALLAYSAYRSIFTPCLWRSQTINSSLFFFFPPQHH